MDKKGTKMKKKLMIISMASLLALGGLATVAGALGSGNFGLTKAATSHSDHKGDLTEVGFNWADPTKDGFKPYWRCEECCAADPASSRYDFSDKTKAVTADELRLSALEAAAASDIASGDGIANVNTQKFK